MLLNNSGFNSVCKKIKTRKLIIFNSSLTTQARLRLADLVSKEDVNEAMRLMKMSKDTLNPSYN